MIEMTMKQFLMCKPTKFNVCYLINPWMDGNVDKVDKTLALKEWSLLYQVLLSIGAYVILTDDQPDDCPDAVFTANAGIVYKNLFVTSKFMHPERQQEESFFREQATKLKLIDVPIKTESKFEGAGDALFSNDKSILWMGYGFRTHYGFQDLLKDVFNVNTRALHLRDSRWYHLDTCFCPLDTGEVLWYPGAFDTKSQILISNYYGSKLITVTEEDALKFACNAISINNHIVMPIVSSELQLNLKNRGYIVVMVNMSQFLRSGGACKCLTLEF